MQPLSPPSVLQALPHHQIISWLMRSIPTTGVFPLRVQSILTVLLLLLADNTLYQLHYKTFNLTLFFPRALWLTRLVSCLCPLPCLRLALCSTISRPGSKPRPQRAPNGHQVVALAKHLPWLTSLCIVSRTSLGYPRPPCSNM